MCICAEQLHAQLCAMAEPSFAAFYAQADAGGRGRAGRAAAQIAETGQADCQRRLARYLRQAQDTSYEEIMLQGMVIGYAPIPDDEVFDVVRWFVAKDRQLVGVRQLLHHVEVCEGASGSGL